MPAWEVLALDTATPQVRAPAAGDTYAMPRPLAITPPSLTSSISPLSITATYNASGVVMPGALSMDVTNTASAAGSLLARIRCDGATVFTVAAPYGRVFTAEGFSTVNGGSHIFGTRTVFAAPGVGALSITKFDGTATAQLWVPADHTLEQYNGTSAQTYNLYGTRTDASNYRRVTLTMSTAGVAVLRPEGLGTGASGNVLHISGLPTSNPGPGILWNNAGTPAIGT